MYTITILFAHHIYKLLFHLKLGEFSYTEKNTKMISQGGPLKSII